MADGDVQGLLVRIEATTAQLRQEMARGEAAVAQNAGKIDSSLGKVDKAFDRAGDSAKTLYEAITSAASSFGGFNIAAVGSIAGLVALTSSTIDHAREVKNLASVSNASVEEFQRMAYGAKTVGIEQDKLGDILKDVNDRVGEFIQRGGGEMADFFNEIAPKVGVTAEQFKNLSGPQALQLYYTSLEKAGLNQQQLTTYMEAMGDESTALIPLLQSNGKGFKDLGDRAEKFGLVISKLSIERLVDAGQAVKDLQGTFSGASQQLVVGLLPGIESVTKGLAHLRDDGGAQKVGETIAFLAENIDVLAAALGGKLAAAFAKYAIDAVTSAGLATAAFLQNVSATKASTIAKAEEAAVAAEGAAAKLREAVAAASATTALQAEAVARVANLEAVRQSLGYQAALAAGSAEETQLKNSLAAVELELTAARTAEAKATQAQGVASAAAAGAMARDTAATQANAAAQAEAAAAKGVLARAGAGLLGLLGGPAGIAALAIGAGVAFLTMGGNAKTAVTGMDELKRSTDDVRKSFQDLAKDQQRSALVGVIREQESAASTADEAFAAFLKTSKQVLGSTVATRIAGDAEQARKAGKGLSDTIDDWQKRFHIPEEGMRSLQDAAGALSTAEQRTHLLADRAALYRTELDKGSQVTQVNTGLTADQTLAVNTLQKSLEKQLNTLQDKTAVDAANRVLTDNNIAATSKEGQALLTTAAAIDKQKAADQAAAKAKSDANSAAQKAISLSEGQQKALTDLEANAQIAITSARGLADAYLAGTDKSRELTLQQKVEEAVLKTGAAARAEVEKALRAQADAEDRLAVSKQAYDLGKETADLIAQAKATLQGADALQAYNVQKAMQATLANKNIEAGSKEYEQLLAATKAQQDAVKTLKQAGDAGSILDRLYPESKLLRDYTNDQNALNAAMKLYPERADDYRAALQRLGLEYEENKNASSAWGKFTEGAVDRVDSAFADMWKSILGKSGNFFSSFKDSFNQFLAEVLHMAITRPIIVQIGASLGVGGLAAQAASAGGGGGGTGVGSLLNGASSLYSAATGWGKALYTGYQSGGLAGAWSGLGSYSSGVLAGWDQAAGQLFGTISNGSSALTYAPISYQAGNGAFAGAGQAIGTYAPWASAIGGAFMGYQNSGAKGAAAGAAGGYLGAKGGAAIGSYFGPIGTAAGAVIGGLLGSIGGSKLFAGDWVTKNSGIQLGVKDGDLDAYAFKYQKKKGGLFGSNKKRTQLTALDDQLQGQLQDAFDGRLDTVFGLFDKLHVDVKDGALDGLNIAAQQISTQDLTSEQVTQLISDWFEVLGNEAVGAISKSMKLNLDGYNVNQLTDFVNNLYSINDTFKLLNVNALPVSIWGGKLAEQYVALAGGMEAFNTATQTYYNAFFTDEERAVNTLAGIRKEFSDLNVTLPDSKEGFRAMVEGIDSTTDAGRQLFIQLTALSGDAATAYQILKQQSDAAKQAAADAAQQLIGNASAAFSGLQRAINAQKTSVNDMLATANANVSDLTAISTSFSNALKALRGDSDSAVRMLRAQAQATLQSALIQAQAGKSLAGFDGLTDALDTVSNNNTDLYSSLEDFNRDQGRTANVVAELNRLNGKQLTSAEQTVKTLQDQLKALDDQLAFAQAQLDALNGVDNSVLTVTDAVKAMNAAVVAAIAGLSGKGTAANNGVLIDSVYQDVLGRNADKDGKAYWQGQVASGALGLDQLPGAIKNAAAEDAIKNAYTSVLGHSADAAGAKYWADQVSSGALTVAQLAEAIKNAAAANGSLPGHATGGLITGPGTGTSDSIVARLSNGEYVMTAAATRMFGTGLLDQMNAGQIPAFASGGPVLSVPTIGAVASSSAQRSGSSDGTTVAELRAIRDEIRNGLSVLADHARKTSDNTGQLAEVGTQVVGTVQTKVVA
ncbi:DUF4214 domain-containing protein [Pseudomonas sp. NPDC088368]|uniref:DUF4214 domain-containing protein n=1 Tax=Pseudomonas sp. NPDC088368 TaxID=3364453 RepID=UPI0038044A40